MRRFCALLLLLLSGSGLVAKPPGAGWRICYLDALSGIDVMPDQVQGSPEVQARGYRDVDSTMVIPADEAGGELRLHLDPLASPIRLTPESIRERTGSDRMLVHGFVVADESGLPLSGAKARPGLRWPQPGSQRPWAWTVPDGVRALGNGVVAGAFESRLASRVRDQDLAGNAGPLLSESHLEGRNAADGERRRGDLDTGGVGRWRAGPAVMG